jgi:hypothetical protein
MFPLVSLDPDVTDEPDPQELVVIPLAWVAAM